MFSLAKWTAIFVIVAIVLGTLSLWWNTFIVGAYYVSAGVFLAVLGAAAPVLVLAVAFLAIRFLVNLTADDVGKLLE